MCATYTIPLDFFSAIVVGGANSEIFLQSQLTCDVRKVTKNQGSLGACCDYKGRIVSNFYVAHQEGENYYLFLPKSMVCCAIDHLEKYSILSKVELSTVNDLTTCTQLPNSVETVSIEENFWKAWNIEIGLVWIYPQTRTKLIPQMINLQRWEEALSFTKGCYIGQEVIARTHYLGKLKRRLYRANVVCQNLPEPGAKLSNQDNQNVGIIVEVASKKNKEYKLLAVLQDAAVVNDILFDRSVLENISVV